MEAVTGARTTRHSQGTWDWDGKEKMKDELVKRMVIDSVRFLSAVHLNSALFISIRLVYKCDSHSTELGHTRG